MVKNNQNLSSIAPEESRAFVLSSIAIATGVFGISFYYGAFGTVFFDHLFYVWVASTVAFVASLFVPPVDALPAFISWRGRFVLGLPSVFMIWLFFSENPSLNIANAGWVEWVLAIVIVGLTLPYLIFVLILVAIPDIEQLQHPRLRTAIVVIAFMVVLAGYGIGRHHDRFITCYDFEISGNYIPENCRKETTQR